MNKDQNAKKNNKKALGSTMKKMLQIEKRKTQEIMIVKSFVRRPQNIINQLI